MSDSTIRDMKQKNNVLKDKLNQLFKQKGSSSIDGDETIHDIKLVQQTIATTNDDVDDEDKENIKHSKRYNELKYNIDEIKNTKYDLPKSNINPYLNQVKHEEKKHITKVKQEQVIHSNGNGKAYDDELNSNISSFTTTKDRPSLLREESLIKKIQNQEHIISSLQHELSLKALEKEDLIEEFQLKIINETKSIERRLYRESVNREKELKLKYDSVIEDMNRTHATEMESLKKELLTKLIKSKYDYNVLKEKNASLISINDYLSHSQHMAENHNNFNNNQIIPLSPLYSGDENTDVLIAKYATERNETQFDLETPIDSTTDHLIKDYDLHHTNNTSKPKSLKSYIWMVIFINRLKSLMNQRKVINQRIVDFSSSDDFSF
ncbi:hypothetical protein DFJ63DRAFT_27542 [Scheffersomyces coipomensis]|uniref:uncharacterized protein n=1 Tax=Scheffersomyces coipomensis TaxID=1788519 RepID=UPI00315C7D32